MLKLTMKQVNKERPGVKRRRGDVDYQQVSAFQARGKRHNTRVLHTNNICNLWWNTAITVSVFVKISLWCTKLALPHIMVKENKNKIYMETDRDVPFISSCNANVPRDTITCSLLKVRHTQWCHFKADINCWNPYQLETHGEEILAYKFVKREVH